MKQLYTEHDILRFLYNEMDEEEYQSFFEVLCKDPEMWAAYEALQDTKEMLPQLALEPSVRSENRILEAARVAAEAMKAKPSGQKQNRRQPYLWASVSLLFFMALGYSYEAGILSPASSTQEDRITEDHSWIHHRLQRMEDERLLPTQLKGNQYQLVNYSGQKVFKFTTGQP
jgi:hypothetical protein